MAKTNETKWFCPVCKKPEVVAGYLGWRDCKACGWEERRPTELREDAPVCFIVAYQPTPSHNARKVDAGGQVDAERAARELTETGGFARVYHTDPNSYGYKFVCTYRDGRRGMERDA